MKPSCHPLWLSCGIFLCCLATTSPIQAQLSRADINAGATALKPPPLAPGIFTESTWYFVNRKSLLVSTCLTSGESQFIVTGRGGLPPNPSEPLSSDAVWSDTRLLATTLKKHHEKTVCAPKPSTPAAVPIVPATGWVFNGKGEVTLTASAPTESLQIPWITPATCHAQ
jgi:hypothetical protein